MQLASECLSRGRHDAGHEQGDRQCDRAGERNAAQNFEHINDFKCWKEGRLYEALAGSAARYLRGAQLVAGADRLAVDLLASMIDRFAPGLP